MKRTLLKPMLLLCALIVGSGSVWADDSYTQVTAVGDIDTDATYILADVVNGSAKAFGTLSSNRGSIVSSGLSVNGTTITVSGSAATKPLEFSLTKSGDNYILSYGETPTYLTYSSGTTFATTTTLPTANGGKWNIAYNETYSCLLINNVGTSARYILRNGTSAYGPYSNQNLGSYGRATLYKKVTSKADPTITFNDGSVRVGKKLDLSTLFTSNSEGTVTYSITSGGSNATLDGSMLTGVAEGNVTVEASQAESGTHNAGSKSATITVEAALVLSSIAVTTAPAKTTYTEGDTFDTTGMVVTATYSDSSEDDVTAQCTISPSGALTTSDAEVTISYTENGVTKTATQAITVNAQPTSVTMSLNNAFFGTAFTGADAKGSGPHTGVEKNVTVNFSSGGSTNNFYISDTEIRAYSGNTLEFVAPTGFVITKIEFTNAWATNTTVTEGNLNSNRKEWTNTNGSSSVGFKPTSRSDMTSLTVTLQELLSVTITSAKYATYCSTKALDFSTTDITVYKAKVEGSAVKLTEVTNGIVPADEGVILYAETADTYTVPVMTTAATISDNELVGVTEDTAIEYSAGGKYNYILQKDGDDLVFRKATGAKLRANRAYLSTTYDVTAVGAPALEVIIGGENGDDNTTGVSEKVAVDGSEASAPVYNLNGQRVSQPTKGLYIVNGKKVILK